MAAFIVTPLARRLIAAGGMQKDTMDFFLNDVIPVLERDDHTLAQMDYCLNPIYTSIGEDGNWEALAAIDEMLTFNGFEDRVGFGVTAVLEGAIDIANRRFIKEFMVRKHPIFDDDDIMYVLERKMVVFLVKEGALQELLQSMYWLKEPIRFKCAMDVALNWTFSDRFNAHSIISAVEEAMDVKISINGIYKSPEHEKAVKEQFDEALETALHKKPFVQTMMTTRTALDVEVEITVACRQEDGTLRERSDLNVELEPLQLELRISDYWFQETINLWRSQPDIRFRR